jgi:tripeptidyl-peptidase I
MKLGLAGVTVLYSSGDNGVAGNKNVCCTQRNCAGATYSSGKDGLTFNPSFPATCPYVTAVGATQIKPGASVTAPEVACETVIYSGGGFSNVFAQPSYQAAAVATYYKHYNPHYRPRLYVPPCIDTDFLKSKHCNKRKLTLNSYNDSKIVRGYPDVSANGANYLTVVDGKMAIIYGTSASAPTFGSIITLINEHRAHAGKGPVGFINPTIYAHADAFNDITSGNNPGCGTKGFTAVPGWDPVTGLGTPNYHKLLDVFMGLP